MKFVGLVGSNYDQSYNRKLLEFIRRHFKLKFELEVLEIDEVPMFNQDEKWDESFQLRLLYNRITRAGAGGGPEPVPAGASELPVDCGL